MKKSPRAKKTAANNEPAADSERPLTGAELEAYHRERTEDIGYHKGDWARRWVLGPEEVHDEGACFHDELLKQREADLLRQGFRKSSRGPFYEKIHRKILRERHLIEPVEISPDGFSFFVTPPEKGLFLEGAMPHQRSLEIVNLPGLRKLTNDLRKAINAALAQNTKRYREEDRDWKQHLPFRLESVDLGATRKLRALMKINWPLIRALQVFDSLSPGFPAFSLQPLHGQKDTKPYLDFLDVLALANGLMQRRGAPGGSIISESDSRKAIKLRQQGWSIPRIVAQLHPTRAHSEERDKLIKRYQRALKDVPVSQRRAPR